MIYKQHLKKKHLKDTREKKNINSFNSFFPNQSTRPSFSFSTLSNFNSSSSWSTAGRSIGPSGFAACCRDASRSYEKVLSPWVFGKNFISQADFCISFKKMKAEFYFGRLPGYRVVQNKTKSLPAKLENLNPYNIFTNDPRNIPNLSTKKRKLTNDTYN